MEKLNILIREKKTHHEARKTRREGKVPGILYGKAIKNMLFEIGAIELDRYIVEEGCNSLIDVDINGENHKAMIKEVQRDPINRKIIHLDLQQVEEGKIVTANVPVNFVGEDNLVRNGIVLQKQKDSIKVKCEAENIPKAVTIDVAKAKVGDNFKISDVEFGQEISIMDSLDSVMASVTFEQKVKTLETIEEGQQRTLEMQKD
ncbi:50S ribosomal protein L25 [Clostridium mediterraneense]|uniref:50S ribosomal protein L25 n=1 Tax=Clostridium mediterraneense TaxID=1805472 RepID=UPI00082A2610|nr:50S ribosomal protein L25 [Clostridium mediterraneense]